MCSNNTVTLLIESVSLINDLLTNYIAVIIETSLGLRQILTDISFVSVHACKLAKLGGCIAKCMATINKIYITFTFLQVQQVQQKEERVSYVT